MINQLFDDGGQTDRWARPLLSVLRIVTALLFLEHGTSKMLMFPLTSMSGPDPWSLYWIAGIIELVGGLFLLVGLLSRPVALLLSGEMAIGYWAVHAPHSVFPVVNGGEAAVLFCFAFLYIAFAGPGPWSVDAWLTRRWAAEGNEGYWESVHHGRAGAA
ncbi:DoxX family protein [Sphingomonas ginkgonis]|uniref:DoxX family protein n=1 Tax=Sphingomonas ginkgonis TaxID=2315330 RepID=A0A3R9WQL2_9SPHN|nr:DoxX family protein [Sphingomonas ginkgonis]RST31057.1 DoxX family protein [Sphingomonas ginkgonis]